MTEGNPPLSKFFSRLFVAPIAELPRKLKGRAEGEVGGQKRVSVTHPFDGIAPALPPASRATPTGSPIWLAAAKLILLRASAANKNGQAAFIVVAPTLLACRRLGCAAASSFAKQPRRCAAKGTRGALA
jgi:hypothetical protein